MKKISLSILLAAVCLSVSARGLVTVPKVDERTELLSIVFRLAGAKEYVTDRIPPSYAEDIDAWFAPYREHEAISYVPELREKYGISYDAVMSYAVNIEIVNGKPEFIKDRGEGSLEGRWKQEPADKFLTLLGDFYTESRFHDFFVKHRALYDVAEARFADVFKTVDMEWFERFYGAAMTGKVGKLGCIISLCNGQQNYGVSVLYKDGKLDACPVIGTGMIDNLGMPVYMPESIRALVVHEFNHPFCNPLIDAYYSRMQESAAAIFVPVKDVMRRNAYGSPKTMLSEMLVRACVIQYGQTVHPRLQGNYFTEDIQRGFVWIMGLNQLLNEYQADRAKYPSLEDFMPEVVKYIGSLSPGDIPRIVSTNITPGAQDVDPGLKEIVVKFDKPMLARKFGYNYGRKGKDYIPEITGMEWRTDNEWVLSVNLKPGTEYMISFPGASFLSGNNVAGLGMYNLDFKTGE